MKKHLYLFLALFLTTISQNFSSGIAQSQSSIFAQITQDEIYFYTSPISSSEYQLFLLPKTYYVELLSNAQDENDEFYSARYIDISGYVKKSEVQPVVGTPSTPFAQNTSFRIFALSGLDLKSTPSSTTPFNRIINVPYLSTNLIFYGTKTGEEMIPGKSNVWYYCKFITGQSQYYGYLYSEFCDNLSPIQQNTENLPYLQEELFTASQDVTSETSIISSPTKPIKILLILAVSLPCINVLYLLFKPTKLINNTQHKKSKHKINRLKKSEYYELDN